MWVATEMPLEMGWMTVAHEEAPSSRSTSVITGFLIAVLAYFIKEQQLILKLCAKR